MTIFGVLAALAFLVYMAAVLSAGVWLGRRQARASHQCPPQITVDDLFAARDRFWDERKPQVSTSINIERTYVGRHRRDDYDADMQRDIDRHLAAQALGARG